MLKDETRATRWSRWHLRSKNCKEKKGSRVEWSEEAAAGSIIWKKQTARGFVSVYITTAAKS